MKKSLVLIAIVSGLLAACTNQRETASGQKFTVLKQGDGETIDENKVLVLSYLIKDAKDSVWNDSRKDGFPWLVERKAVLKEKGNVFEVIGMLTKGDSATFVMSAHDFFVKSFHQTLPPKVDSTAKLTLCFSLKNALTNGEEVKKFQSELIAKQNEKMLKQQREQSAKDSVILDDYLKANNITAEKTKSGLRYVITKNGKGPMVEAGKTVQVNYAGHLLNGKYFDTCIEEVAMKEGLHKEGRKYSPLEFVVGRGQVIRGWDEVLQLMNTGEKITAYIPSTLAYGPQRRSDVIVENSILVFEMELVGIK